MYAFQVINCLQRLARGYFHQLCSYPTCPSKITCSSTCSPHLFFGSGPLPPWMALRIRKGRSAERQKFRSAVTWQKQTPNPQRSCIAECFPVKLLHLCYFCVKFPVDKLAMNEKIYSIKDACWNSLELEALMCLMGKGNHPTNKPVRGTQLFICSSLLV